MELSPVRLPNVEIIDEMNEWNESFVGGFCPAVDNEETEYLLYFIV